MSAASSWRVLIRSRDATGDPALIAALKDELISAPRLGATVVTVTVVGVVGVGLTGVELLPPPPHWTDAIANTTSGRREMRLKGAPS